eukprot:TRINITY_DN219_c0_g1_i10.p1 TRINITY_DN219_c0_g1~~TRINITY_DN219_c0_g1_i10.p1  ORF type:complete len:116 (+),score=26.05 TRINITY_DN219_c0_g1_i10:188-535(+)
MPRKSTKMTFGKYKGRALAKLPQGYLAWIVGYSGIGKPSITLPREQYVDVGRSFRRARPEIYSAAMNELVGRAKCLVCAKKLVPFKAGKDWKTRLLHKKCYFEHVDDILETVGIN